MNNLVNTIFLLSVKHREKIITAFKILYIVLTLLVIAASYSIYEKTGYRRIFVQNAVLAGQISIVLYLLTLIPGIFRRFRKQHKFVSILMVYRRYIGVLSFFTMFYHFMMQRGVSLIMVGLPRIPPVFELMGAAAFFIIFLLAVTSNDVSTGKLGVWWGRIHNLTYIIIWFIFFHLALQRFTIWTLLLGITGVVQVLSFIYRYYLSSRT